MFIFISYNLGIVCYIVDRVIVMENGNIVEEGKIEILFCWFKYFIIKKMVLVY